MKLKKYCVTVMDNWTPTREFWTYKGALEFRNEHLASAHLHQWFNGRWIEIIGPAQSEDCPCVGAVIGSHDSSCPYSVTSQAHRSETT